MGWEAMRRIVVGGSIALVCGSAFVAAADLGAPGPYGWASFEDEIVDAARERTVSVLVVYPVPAEDVEPPRPGFPLIAFHHGFLLRGSLYRSYGERLASHGFVVVLPTYAMSLSSANHTELALDARLVIDYGLGLDRETGSPLFGRIDETAVGAAGHSFGGKLSLLEAAADPRVRAIAALDPVDGGGPGPADPVLFPSVTPERMGEITAPLLLVGAELGGVNWFLIPCAPPGENYQRFFETASSPAIEVTQRGAGHGQYVDPGAEFLLSACAPGTAEAGRVRSDATAYLTAFFLGHLGTDATALEWLDARLADDEAHGLISVRRTESGGT
ncbi:MAG: hypothetical protein AB1778_09780 [Candidatus Bipolaricaulota bacterium]